MNHRGHWEKPKIPFDFIDFEEHEGSYYVAFLTCAHNLYDPNAPLKDAKISFGQHGEKSTSKWEGVIDINSVLIPKEYKKFVGKCFLIQIPYLS